MLKTWWFACVALWRAARRWGYSAGVGAGDSPAGWLSTLR